MSMQSEPAASPSARPPGPSVAARTASGEGSIVIATSAPLGRLARARAQRSTPVDRGRRVEVEAAHLVTGRDEVRRHQAPHAAESDECDDGHGSPQPVGTNGPAL